MNIRAVVPYAPKLRLGLIALMLCAPILTNLHAGTITIAGTITQSVQDGTGPAVNNPGLNTVLDGAIFAINFTLRGIKDKPPVRN